MNDTLTNKQLRVIPYLLGSRSIEEGCRRARVSKATVYAWLKEGAFKRELRYRRDAVIERALDTLKTNMVRATETLVKLLESEKEIVRLKAAERIIKVVERAMEIEQANKQHIEEYNDWLTPEQKKQLEYAEKMRRARMSEASEEDE